MYMTKDRIEQANFVKGWQLLLISDVFWWLKTVLNNQGSLESQLPYTLATIVALIAVGFFIAAVVVGIINIIKKRRQNLGKVIGLTLLGVVLFLLFGLA
jgi:uncharacterized Tic20 family protein